MSVIVFADGDSCPVKNSRGANGAVVLSHNNAQSGDNGQVCVTLSFKGDRGNNSSSNQISVMVYCYDAQGHYVDAKSVNVKMDGTLTYACFNVEKEKPYTFQLKDAYCK